MGDSPHRLSSDAASGTGVRLNDPFMFPGFRIRAKEVKPMVCKGVTGVSKLFFSREMRHKGMNCLPLHSSNPFHSHSLSHYFLLCLTQPHISPLTHEYKERMYGNKQPSGGPRKTTSKSASKKQQLLDIATSNSRPSSRAGSRVGSRANSDDEGDDHSEAGRDDFEDSADDHHHQRAEVTWESQLKDAIEELNEKRSR